jgi:hypothetical protein
MSSAVSLLELCCLPGTGSLQVLQAGQAVSLQAGQALSPPPKASEARGPGALCFPAPAPEVLCRACRAASGAGKSVPCRVCRAASGASASLHRRRDGTLYTTRGIAMASSQSTQYAVRSAILGYHHILFAFNEGIASTTHLKCYDGIQMWHNRGGACLRRKNERFDVLEGIQSEKNLIALQRYWSVIHP